MTNERILLTTDLDRTLLPNGKQPEQAGIRRIFSSLCQREEIVLAYVSGRDKRLVLEAIAEYQLPLPDYVIGDVGSSLYHIQGHRWQMDQAWQARIAPDWGNYDHENLVRLLTVISELQLQEPAKQNRYKLSYYLPLSYPHQPVLQRLHELLQDKGVKANIIWSIDEPNQIGLIDILPQSANKLEAIRFLGRQLGIPLQRTLFAGDSGNDISVLSSEVPAVLVANAEDYVRQEALQQAQAQKLNAALYCAREGDLGLNGNYAAGILQGLAHYFPEAKSWLEPSLTSS